MPIHPGQGVAATPAPSSTRARRSLGTWNRHARRRRNPAHGRHGATWRMTPSTMNPITGSAPSVHAAHLTHSGMTPSTMSPMKGRAPSAHAAPWMTPPTMSPITGSAVSEHAAYWTHSRIGLMAPTASSLIWNFAAAQALARSPTKRGLTQRTSPRTTSRVRAAMARPAQTSQMVTVLFAWGLSRSPMPPRWPHRSMCRLPRAMVLCFRTMRRPPA
mmetsp:Transcript_108688/g.325098  ORF Transcript_108688/g.325098 Transcript_108688/m.325098 type:complete len:216 (-) Transcript_108688:809-1456(-)